MKERTELADEAMRRLIARLGAQDPRAAAILLGQAGLEHEVHAILHRVVQRPDRLVTLKHEHRVQVLRAIYADDWAQLVLDAVEDFTKLRNSFAHGRMDEVGARLEALRQSYSKVGDGIDEPAGIALALVTALHVSFESTADGAVRTTP